MKRRVIIIIINLLYENFFRPLIYFSHMTLYLYGFSFCKLSRRKLMLERVSFLIRYIFVLQHHHRIATLLELNNKDRKKTVYMVSYKQSELVNPP